MWHSDDQFWKTYGPWMFTEKRWANTPAEVDSILKLLRPAPQGAGLPLRRMPATGISQIRVLHPVCKPRHAHAT